MFDDDTPRKTGFIGSTSHLVLAIAGAIAVTTGTWIGGEKDYESKLTGKPESENTAASLLQEKADAVIADETHLRLLEQTIELSKKSAASENSPALREKFKEIGNLYGQLEYDRLQVQGKYADLMNSFLSTDGVSEKTALRIYDKFSTAAMNNNYRGIKAHFFPLQEALAFRDECAAEVTVQYSNRNHDIVQCMRESDDTHDFKEMAVGIGSGAGFFVMSFHLAAVAASLISGLSRRRNKPEEKRSKVTVIERFDP